MRSEYAKAVELHAEMARYHRMMLSIDSGCVEHANELRRHMDAIQKIEDSWKLDLRAL